MQRKDIGRILAGATLKGVGVTENDGKVSSIVLHLQDGQKLSIGNAVGGELPVQLVEAQPEQPDKNWWND